MITLTAEQAQQIEEALDTAKNGLLWYRSEYPEAGSGADDEAQETVDEALAIIRAARAQEQAEQEPVAFADKYGNVMKAKEKLESTNVNSNWYDRPLYEKTGFDADLYSVAGRLALELECLLLDTKDLSVTSKWWDSAHDALEQWRSIKDAVPVEPMKYEPVAKNDGGRITWLVDNWPQNCFLYAAPVRTKDLTDVEILAVARGIGIVFDESDKEQQIDDIQVFARAVIAADREKNK